MLGCINCSYIGPADRDGHCPVCKRAGRTFKLYTAAQIHEMAADWEKVGGVVAAFFGTRRRMLAEQVGKDEAGQ